MANSIIFLSTKRAMQSIIPGPSRAASRRRWTRSEMRPLDAAPWRDQSLGGRGACETDGKGADVACHLGDTAGRRRARSKHARLAKE